MSLFMCVLNIFGIIHKKVVKNNNLRERELDGCGQRLFTVDPFMLLKSCANECINYSKMVKIEKKILKSLCFKTLSSSEALFFAKVVKFL